MSVVTIIILFVVLGLAALFIFKRMHSYHKTKHTPPQDSSLQAVYDQKNKAKEDNLNLTLEEKMDLSWQFLTDISEKIVQSFSSQDQKQVQHSGSLLAQNGAKYNHNVDQEISIGEKFVKAKVIEKDIEQNKGHSR